MRMSDVGEEVAVTFLNGADTAEVMAKELRTLLVSGSIAQRDACCLRACISHL